MARKTRDYSNLRETERLYDAIDKNSTEVKDYSLKHNVSVGWRITSQEIRKRLVRINIDGETFIGRGLDILDATNEMLEEADEDNWLPRGRCVINGIQGTLIISTEGVNRECLRDHVVKLHFNGKTPIIDIEELLKATRYA